MGVGLYLLSTMDTDTTRFMSGVFMAVVGLGMGCLMQITMLVAQNSVQMKDMGVASSTSTLSRTLGSSFGVAIMGALFNNRVQDVMAERAGALGSKVTEQSATLNAASLAKLPHGGAGGVSARGVCGYPLRVPAGGRGRCGRDDRRGVREGGSAQGGGAEG